MISLCAAQRDKGAHIEGPSNGEPVLGTTYTVLRMALELPTKKNSFFSSLFGLLDYIFRPSYRAASVLLEEHEQTTYATDYGQHLGSFISPIHSIQHRKRERSEPFAPGKIDDLAYMFIWIRILLPNHE